MVHCVGMLYATTIQFGWKIFFSLSLQVIVCVSTLTIWPLPFVTLLSGYLYAITFVLSLWATVSYKIISSHLFIYLFIIKSYSVYNKAKAKSKNQTIT